MKDCDSLINKIVQKILINDLDKTFAFERSRYIFIFNFHPSNSYENYEIPILPGQYNHVLDSDESQFGGQNRISNQQIFHSIEHNQNQETTHFLKVYIPSRTALVLKKDLL
ncbi:MAG: hypothetical protein COA79_02745 [Planctomycetota bacterium]|nr:MAG: hypothetical protein COA79_02745 [Planctomycetota bacterium]